MNKFHSIEEKVIYQKLIKGIGKVNTPIELSAVTESRESGNLDQYDIAKISRYITEIGQYIDVLEKTRENKAFRYIKSHRKYIGKGIIFCKRVMRKCLKWYIEPICFQQTDFNNAITPSIGKLTEIQSELVNAILAIDAKQNILKNEIMENCDYMKKYIKQTVELIESEINFKEQNITMKIDALENIQNITNRELVDIADEIMELDLDIFKKKENNFWNKKTMAQSGEDAIVAYITMVLGLKFEECTYLDLGANHAKDLSNTYLFYSKGAKGVLVEANPALIPELKFYRSEDIIINKCISTHSGDTIDFYILNGDGLSTPDLDVANKCIQENPNLEIIDTIRVETITVNDIIDKYLENAPVIMNIDIEGKDIEILESIDFDKYRPLIIIAEMIDYKTSLIIGEKNNKIIELMVGKNYVEYAFTGINSIFIDKEQIGEGK